MRDAKRRLLVLVIAVVALPFVASAQNARPVEDSPLVAAAKLSKRRGSPTVVITNDTLARNGASAHMTTTKHQAPLAKAPAPVAQPAATTDQKAANAGNKKAKVEPHDDADLSDEEPATEPPLTSCPACLTILNPSPGLQISKAEPSSTPPRIVAPQPGQVVAGQAPVSKKP